jgi:hypothetical protein
VLTNPEHTSEWAPEFLGGVEFRIESAWKLGSPVLWKGQDGITYELTEYAGKTTFRLLQGDFSVMTEGEKDHRLSAEVWDRVLPKVKALAEK